MANESKHPSDLSKNQLQTNLQKSETIRQSVASIAAKKNQFVRFTGATHDFSKPVPTGTLRLELDPTGALEPLAGHTLVCRGTAWISDDEKKVAVFRAI